MSKSETDVPWASHAPQYKKDGELYSKVEYDHEGNPVRVRVAQNQTRRGEWDMDDGTAVYDPHNVLTLQEFYPEAVEYVKQLPFVDEVDMGDLE